MPRSALAAAQHRALHRRRAHQDHGHGRDAAAHPARRHRRAAGHRRLSAGHHRGRCRSAATVIEHHIQHGAVAPLSNSATLLALERDARIEHYRVFAAGEQAVHFDSLASAARARRRVPAVHRRAGRRPGAHLARGALGRARREARQPCAAGRPRGPARRLRERGAARRRAHASAGRPRAPSRAARAA